MLRQESLQAVIDMIEAGSLAAGVLKDTYMSQTKPAWVVLQTDEEALQVERLLEKARNRKNPDSHSAWIDLKQVVGDCLPDHLSWVYRDGAWLVSPVELLMELEAWAEEEDYELPYRDDDEETGWGEFVEAQSARMQLEAESYEEEDEENSEPEDDTPEEEEEGPWGWTRAEYYNAKFGEEG
ncbi:MAG: hypothetical protein UU77_C0001G0019 [candidate division WWE3 bacterium GW2011_GWC1_41_7]|uniref:Uncharacterized protein n=3 Tax=Katanobacteria TaxID=422282 RepID=A0A0G0X901_UNCKA|nr:MAG: hypothetical protein UU72_C0003G0020 [candidate division WWE3 bacterium GW2011_GWB1_41_6]KKS21524.1 MAG: hypothetical protein UU77_C0001G0019 [candidate division WWE3 bacterium GW2011_GWC1_41_7]OGC56919.1 MAG: hypothetical protein A2976_00695 [candidate division WWE3 bacterium RIFCSPLOWO2_01_FULL_41_9]